MRKSAHRIPAAVHDDRREQVLRSDVNEAPDHPAGNGTRCVVIYSIDRVENRAVVRTWQRKLETVFAPHESVVPEYGLLQVRHHWAMRISINVITLIPTIGKQSYACSQSGQLKLSKHWLVYIKTNESGTQTGPPAWDRPSRLTCTPLAKDEY